MDQTELFEQERGRLLSIATRVLDDRHEAEDAVQQTWLRLHAYTALAGSAPIENLAAWLTTVTTRLCIDRLRARVPVPVSVQVPVQVPVSGSSAGFQEVDYLSRADDAGFGLAAHGDPLESLEHLEAVGQALHVVLDLLSPNERVALVLHESFGVDFAMIGDILDVAPATARKLASRARAKVASAQRGGPVSDRHVVDAFMEAAKGSDLGRLLALLAPGAAVSADAEAIAAGTPRQLEGRDAVANFFNGSAHAALPSTIDGRPGAAWFNRGRAMVAFDFTVVDGVVESIVFRAEPDVLARVIRRPLGS